MAHESRGEHGMSIAQWGAGDRGDSGGRGDRGAARRRSRSQKDGRTAAAAAAAAAAGGIAGETSPSRSDALRTGSPPRIIVSTSPLLPPDLGTRA